jgi:phosphate transport system protein
MYHYLEEGLEELRTKLIKMGSLVEEQLDFALKCLFENNNELGKLVIERDSKVDSYDVKIDKLCQKIFALTQPVAVDLRLIMSALKINNDLERIGDIAVNIVERAENLEGKLNFMKESGLIDMADKVKIIVKKTIDSIVNNDHEIALGVIKSDTLIDKLEIEIFEEIIRRMEMDPVIIRTGVICLSLVKNFERLADHSTNIAEEIVFLVDSKIIKHKRDLGDLGIKAEEII